MPSLLPYRPTCSRREGGRDPEAVFSRGLQGTVIRKHYRCFRILSGDLDKQSVFSLPSAPGPHSSLSSDFPSLSRAPVSIHHFLFFDFPPPLFRRVPSFAFLLFHLTRSNQMRPFGVRSSIASLRTVPVCILPLCPPPRFTNLAVQGADAEMRELLKVSLVRN